MRILVTGAAGFIGFHLTQALLAQGHSVFGIDNLNDYYDVALKEARLAQLRAHDNFSFLKTSLEDAAALDHVFADFKPTHVVNLAAQAGVRYSITNPSAYITSNLVGFGNVLESCRHHAVEHLIFASSSSVYGANTKVPFATEDNVDHPLSLYAATKKANELMAHTYANLYKLPCTGLRFFTVYGPWGRPDMAVFSFTKAIIEGRAIDVYNHGDMMRDFTYIDDIVDGILRVIPCVPQGSMSWNGNHPNPSTSFAPYKIYNIGNNKPEKLMDMISFLEQSIGASALKNFLPMQQGDVPATYADISDLTRDTGFIPTTSLSEGLQKFVAWYRGYYRG